MTDQFEFRRESSHEFLEAHLDALIVPHKDGNQGVKTIVQCWTQSSAEKDNWKRRALQGAKDLIPLHRRSFSRNA